MSWVDDLADHLGSLDLVGGADGYVVTIDEEPEEPDRIVAIFVSGGQDPDPLIVLPNFQIRTRAEKGASGVAFDKILAVKDALRNIDDQLIGSTRFVMIRQVADVQPAGLDENSRPGYLINMRTIQED